MVVCYIRSSIGTKTAPANRIIHIDAESNKKDIIAFRRSMLHIMPRSATRYKRKAATRLKKMKDTGQIKQH